MNDENKQFLVRHADALRTLHDIPNDGKFTDTQLIELTTHPKRAIRIAGKEGCDCSNLTKLVEAIENRDFAALGELIEPARLEVYGMIDGTSPVTKTTNGAPIDLDFARRAAAKSQAKRDEEAKHFEKGQQFQRALDRYNIAWNAWCGTWENIALSRAGMLASEAGKEDLSAALNGLVEVIRDRGFIENLSVAVERFDPSYCDGTDDEEEAYAVKILLQALNTVASGTAAGEVAAALLSLDPLPLLFRAGSIRRLLRVADHWPILCESCGETQPPPTFDSEFCNECSLNGESMRLVFMSDPMKRPIAAPPRLFQSIGKLDNEITAILRTLGLYEIGLKRTEAAQRLIEYLASNTDHDVAVIEMTPVRIAIQQAKEVFGSPSSNITSQDAASSIPQPLGETVQVTTVSAETKLDDDGGGTEQLPTSKTHEKVSDIPADKLVPYLGGARLHLKWIEANKPSGEKLQWFLDESESMIDPPAWEKLRSTSRRTAYRYGFKVDGTKQWVKSLEIEIAKRRKAGIFVPGAEDWE